MHQSGACIPGTTAAHHSRLHAPTLCNAFAVMPQQLCMRVAILVTSAVIFYITRSWINVPGTTAAHQSRLHTPTYTLQCFCSNAPAVVHAGSHTSDVSCHLLYHTELDQCISKVL